MRAPDASRSADDDLAAAEALIDAARAAGADAADVLVASETALDIGVADGALEEAERSEGIDLGLRVFVGQRQACVAASNVSPGTFAEMATRAVAIAREAPDDPYCALAEPDQLAGLPDADALELADPAPEPDPEALEQQARAAEAAGRAVPGVAMVEQARASWGAERVTLLATNGLEHRIARTIWAVSTSAIAGEGLGRERDFAVEIRRHGGDLPPPEEIGRRAGERAVAAIGARKPPAGRYPVLYDERVAASLLGHLLSAINGQSVARGASWLRDKMGAAVLPDGLDLAEDPHRPRGRASRLVDAEGIATAPRKLVEDGRLVSWVLDLATARQLGLQTTGNARRGPAGPPRPGTANIVLTPGPRSRADLLAEMGTGLLVTSLIGSSVNPTTGAYSRGASGFWVERGEIVHPVNEITIAGNLPEMMRSIRPADDADPHKSARVPSLLVEGLAIGA
ncbi:MAG: TldD/PmbA family protein [Pikeienuella sp.]